SSIVLDFFEAPTFNAVEIPLKGNELVLQLIVPNDAVTGGLEAFSASLDAPTLKQARAGATPRPLQFEMPKVDIQPAMVDYYDPLGFECEPYTLLNVFHGAAIEIDAKGLKAAAVTVVVGDGDSSPELPEESFSVDRPFLFFIYDQSTDFVLFSGRYGGATG